MQLKWPMRWDLFSLFPAYAGVILIRANKTRDKKSFPRIRGGDPYSYAQSYSKHCFSPHTRG